MRYATAITALILGALFLSSGFHPANAGETNQDTVQEVYIAFYGRPADPDGYEYWVAELEATGGALEGIVDSFGSSNEYWDRYGDLNDSQKISSIYANLFGREPETEGLEYWLGELTSGRVTIYQIALSVLNGASGYDSVLVNNQVGLARNATRHMIEYGIPYDLGAFEVMLGLAREDRMESAYGVFSQWAGGFVFPTPRECSDSVNHGLPCAGSVIPQETGTLLVLNQDWLNPGTYIWPEDAPINEESCDPQAIEVGLLSQQTGWTADNATTWVDAQQSRVIVIPGTPNRGSASLAFLFYCSGVGEPVLAFANTDKFQPDPRVGFDWSKGREGRMDWNDPQPLRVWRSDDGRHMEVRFGSNMLQSMVNQGMSAYGLNAQFFPGCVWNSESTGWGADSSLYANITYQDGEFVALFDESRVPVGEPSQVSCLLYGRHQLFLNVEEVLFAEEVFVVNLTEGLFTYNR